jgi:hypothetical protein
VGGSAGGDATGGGSGDGCASADLFVEVIGDGADQRYEARGPNAEKQQPSGSLGNENNADFYMTFGACASATSSDGCIGAEALTITGAGDSSDYVTIYYTAPDGTEYESYGEGNHVDLDVLGAVGEPMSGSYEAVITREGQSPLDLSGNFYVCRGPDWSL